MNLKPGAVTTVIKSIDGVSAESFAQSIKNYDEGSFYRDYIKLSSADPDPKDDMDIYVRLITALEDNLFDIKEYDDDTDVKPKKAKRTIMLFLNGTDLETNSYYASRNLLEILTADIPEDYNIIITTGGTRKWHMDDIKMYKNEALRALGLYEKRRNLSAEETKKVDDLASQMLSMYGTKIQGLQIWKVVNVDGFYNKLELMDNIASDCFMTDPTYLTYFIDRAVEKAPAETYDLIMWDHGGAFKSFANDQLLSKYKHDNPDVKDLPDTRYDMVTLRQGIANTQFIKNGNKLEILGFDACLMGNFEVASKLRDVSDYLVGSEELISGTGWAYKTFLSALAAKPDMTGEQFGKAIVDAYVEKQKKDERATLSVIDMKRIDELDQKLTNFAIALNKEVDENYYSIIASIGNKGHFWTKDGFNNAQMYDLMRLALPFSNPNGAYSQELKDASNDLIAAIDKAVVVTGAKNRQVNRAKDRQANRTKDRQQGRMHHLKLSRL